MIVSNATNGFEPDTWAPSADGYYWFVPSERCPPDTGFAVVAAPVLVFVSASDLTVPASSRLVVRCPNGLFCVNDLRGWWEPCQPSAELRSIAAYRVRQVSGNDVST